MTITIPNDLSVGFTEMDISSDLRENYEVIWCIMDDKAYENKNTPFSKWWYDEQRTSFPNMPTHDQKHSFWHDGEWFSSDDYMYPEVRKMNELENHEKIYLTKIIEMLEMLFHMPTGDVLKHFIGDDVEAFKKKFQSKKSK